MNTDAERISLLSND